MQKLLADANIGLRILRGDKDIEANEDLRVMVEETREIAIKVEDGSLSLVFIDPVVAEMVYVMEKTYKESRQDISELILGLIEADGIESSKSIKEALRIYADTKLDIVDIQLNVLSKDLGIPVLTWDKGFKKLDCEYYSPSDLNRTE
jgi:predicted nucleic-acid-binding protein